MKKSFFTYFILMSVAVNMFLHFFTAPLQSYTQRLTDKEAALVEQIHYLSSVIEKLKTERNVPTLSGCDHETLIDALRKELKTLQEQLAKALQEQKEAQAQLAISQHTLSTAKNETHSLQTINNTYKQTISQLNAELTAKLNELSKHKEKLNQTLHTLSTDRQQQDKAAERISALENELRKNQEKAHLYATALQNLQEEFKKAQSQNASMLHNHEKQKLLQTIKDLEKSLEKLKQEKLSSIKARPRSAARKTNRSSAFPVTGKLTALTTGGTLGGAMLLAHYFKPFLPF